LGGVSCDLCKRLVTAHRHDLVRRKVSLGGNLAEGLSQAMCMTVIRQTSVLAPITNKDCVPAIRKLWGTRLWA